MFEIIARIDNEPCSYTALNKIDAVLLFNLLCQTCSTVVLYHHDRVVSKKTSSTKVPMHV